MDKYEAYIGPKENIKEDKENKQNNPWGSDSFGEGFKRTSLWNIDGEEDKYELSTNPSLFKIRSAYHILKSENDYQAVDLLDYNIYQAFEKTYFINTTKKTYVLLKNYLIAKNRFYCQKRSSRKKYLYC